MTDVILPDSGRSWVSDPYDPDSPVLCGTLDSGIDEAVEGEVRVYAGGLVEGVSYPNDQAARQITFMHLSARQLAQLRAWRGRVVLVRTTDGVRLFCFYLGGHIERLMRTAPEDDYPDNVTFNYQVTAARVSFDETALA